MCFRCNFGPFASSCLHNSLRKLPPPATALSQKKGVGEGSPRDFEQLLQTTGRVGARDIAWGAVGNVLFYGGARNATVDERRMSETHSAEYVHSFGYEGALGA